MKNRHHERQQVLQLSREKVKILMEFCLKDGILIRDKLNVDFSGGGLNEKNFLRTQKADLYRGSYDVHDWLHRWV
jgi:hypothetical protein